MLTKSLRFSDATLSKLNEQFDLQQDYDRSLKSLKNWQKEAQQISLSDFEKRQILALQKPLIRAGRAWNEVELESKFIAPMLMIAQIEDTEFGYFMERPLSFTINEIELYGIVDGLIAKGIREPKVPYVCLQEYKRNEEHQGSADAQTLVAMLVARELNNNERPIYGLFVLV